MNNFADIAFFKRTIHTELLNDEAKTFLLICMYLDSSSILIRKSDGEEEIPRWIFLPPLLLLFFFFFFNEPERIETSLHKSGIGERGGGRAVDRAELELRNESVVSKFLKSSS
jgi:hypothetical protein